MQPARTKGVYHAHHFRLKSTQKKTNDLIEYQLKLHYNILDSLNIFAHWSPFYLA